MNNPAIAEAIEEMRKSETATTLSVDSIKELVPEMSDTILSWLSSHLKAHRYAAQALIATRAEVERLRGELEAIIVKASVQTKIERDGSRSSPVDASLIRVIARNALEKG